MFIDFYNLDVYGEQTKAPPPPTQPPPPPLFLKVGHKLPLKYEGGGQKPPSFSEG